MHDMHMCTSHKVAYILLLVGGLNWGLVGLGSFLDGNWNVVNLILGSWPPLEAIVYLLVGASAIFMLMMKQCKGCNVSMRSGEKKM